MRSQEDGRVTEGRGGAECERHIWSEKGEKSKERKEVGRVSKTLTGHWQSPSPTRHGKPPPTGAVDARGG